MNEELTIQQRLEIEIQLVENDKSLDAEQKAKQIRALQRTAKDLSMDEMREELKHNFD